MVKTKKILLLLLSMFVLAACPKGNVPAAKTIVTTVEGTEATSDYGDIRLGISTGELLSAGYEYADELTVSINSKEYVFPLVRDFKQIETGCPAVVAKDNGDVCLSMLLALFAEHYKIAFHSIGPSGKTEWTPASDDTFPLHISLSMHEKQGYAEMYKIYNLKVRTKFNKTKETVEGFCNFRNITTTGIRKGILFRGASPIDNTYGRRDLCDSLLKSNSIQTAVNLANTYDEALKLEKFDQSYYKGIDLAFCKVTNLDIRKVGPQFAAGIRKIIDGKAPFFFHCQEGIDRTGVFAALLEGICGAGWQEMVDDNMLTYRNYYDIVPGTKAYDQLSQHLFRMFRMLSEDTFDKANVYASTLSIFHKLGITDEEIHALKDKLSQN